MPDIDHAGSFLSDLLCNCCNRPIPQFIRADYAAATQNVLTGTGIIMVVAAVVAIFGLKRGVQAAVTETAAPTPAASRADLRD
jgi:hypothetical protein